MGRRREDFVLSGKQSSMGRGAENGPEYRLGPDEFSQGRRQMCHRFATEELDDIIGPGDNNQRVKNGGYNRLKKQSAQTDKHMAHVISLRYQDNPLPKHATTASGAPRLKGVTYANAVRKAPGLNHHSNFGCIGSREDHKRPWVEVSTVGVDFAWLNGSFTGALMSLEYIPKLGDSLFEARI
ncbi:hypothetical protein Ancab_031924 [Ancistrocladus abbreviatus]